MTSVGSEAVFSADNRRGSCAINSHALSSLSDPSPTMLSLPAYRYASSAEPDDFSFRRCPTRRSGHQPKSDLGIQLHITASEHRSSFGEFGLLAHCCMQQDMSHWHRPSSTRMQRMVELQTRETSRVRFARLADSRLCQDSRPSIAWLVNAFTLWPVGCVRLAFSSRKSRM